MLLEWVHQYLQYLFFVSVSDADKAGGVGSVFNSAEFLINPFWEVNMG